MQRYWVSWYSRNEEGVCTEPPFDAWCTGYAINADFECDEETICAMVDAPSEEAVWEAIARHYPDYRQRFISVREPDATPNDRFPDFENRTGLTSETEGE